MFKSLHTLFAALVLVGASSAQALTIVDADAFAAGDHKAVHDTASGLTWLDYGITNNKSYHQVVSELGSTYAGWRLPTETEVKTLWSNLFSALPGWNADGMGTGWAYYSGDTTFITDIFGTNYDFGGGSIYDLGWFKGDDSGLKYAYISNGGSQMYGPGIDYAQYGYADEVTPYYSTLLVKTSNVPEPSAIFLMALGLFGLGYARRKAV